MKIDLDQLERVAKAAQEDGFITGDGARFLLATECSPDVVIALVELVRAQERAIRFLWNAWADAEGDGQPEVYVFGDAKMDAWLKEQGETHRERAPDDVQQAIREALGK